MATLQELEATRARLLAEREILAAEYQAGDQAVLPEIQAINIRLREVVLQIEALSAPAPIVSSGATVANASVARDDGANTQNPPNAISTEATAPGPASTETGTNGRFRSSTETQSNPAPSTLPGPVGFGSGAQPSGTVAPGGIANPNATPTNTGGVGAPNEDNASANGTTGTTSGVTANESGGTGSNNVQTLANKSARPIIPQPNALDGLASYSYSVSIYLMSPEDYQRLMTTGKKYLAGYQLLMQSGGAPIVGQAVGPTIDFTASDEAGYTAFTQQQSVLKSQGRNQYFPLDYYLDDLELKSVISGKGTGGAHNVVELKFKIIEPNGITLLDNLYNATQQYVTLGTGSTKSVSVNNYAAQNYLMVVRFYGYDQNGNAVLTPNTADPAGRSDSRAIVEKFIPFQFTAIKFRIANKLTEYECSAVCPQNVIGTSQGRGVIPYNIELTATTLQNLFNGNINYVAPNAVTAPDKAVSAPNPTLTTGLTQALNKFQAEQKTSGTYDLPDVYKIVLSHPELANASIVPPGQTNRLAVSMITPTTGAQAKDGEKQSVQNNTKNVSAIAGMSIVQFIDLAVRSSDYIYKQQTKIKTVDRQGKEVDVPQGKSAQAFVWYKIGVEAKPIGPDPKRNDQAYEITYEIAPYAINDIKSEYFPKGVFRGAQKKYNYWFTGENTSILNFEQDFNYLYYITVNSRQAPRTSLSGTSDYREIEKRLFATNSSQTNQGEKGNRNEPAANAAEYLYSPGDQGRVRLTIVGDPAWIQQGEVWSGVRSTKNTNADKYDVYFDAFMPDGTINFDAREALFEIAFNKPADYDLQSGVMKVGGVGTKTQNYVYKATTVTSNFRQGRFTQDLEGVLLIFPDAITKTGNSTTINPGTATGTTVDTDSQRTTPATSADTGRITTGAAGTNADGTTAGSELGTNYSLGQTNNLVNYSPLGVKPGSGGQGIQITNDVPALGFNNTLFPAQNSAPTSGSQVLGPLTPPSNTNYLTGGVTINTVSARIALLNGGTQLVYSDADVNTLLVQGLVSSSAANAAILELDSKTAAQQSPVTSAGAQLIKRDD